MSQVEQAGPMERGYGRLEYSTVRARQLGRNAAALLALRNDTWWEMEQLAREDARREAAGLPFMGPTELARRFGVSRERINRWQAGRRAS